MRLKPNSSHGDSLIVAIGVQGCQFHILYNNNIYQTSNLTNKDLLQNRCCMICERGLTKYRCKNINEGVNLTFMWQGKQQSPYSYALQWRHNERDGVSNHRRLDSGRLMKTSKLRVTGLAEGNPPVTNGFPHTLRASDAENVSIWWRHHGEAMWFCLSNLTTCYIINIAIFLYFSLTKLLDKRMSFRRLGKRWCWCGASVMFCVYQWYWTLDYTRGYRSRYSTQHDNDKGN